MKIIMIQKMSARVLFMFVSAGVALALLSFAHPAMATETMADFEHSIELYQQACAVDCHAPYAEKVMIGASEYDLKIESEQGTATAGPNRPSESELAKLRVELQKVAHNQAQVWGDTILEGDYIAKGETTVDYALAIYKNQKLIAYKINYSEQAWETASCDYDYENEETLSECQAGRISEGSFVSADFQLYFQDPNQYAEFE